ncbi:MAG: GNAT family N-acetyltransferase [Acidimicrobiia bacterium]|nr:GNAT family N-acetyltransferase [Acidimicrobiia bacterium]
MIIRPLISTDVVDAVTLNNAEVPHVGPTDQEHLTRFLDYPGVVWVVEMDGALTGLMVACEPGSTYESTNYRWFDERSDDFIYVDRIVVAPSAQRLGIGRVLYKRLAAAYVGVARQMTCEVNLDPLNEASMAFHVRMGFRQVATKPDGLKTVALLARDLV